MGKDRPEADRAARAGEWKPVLHPTDTDPSAGTPVLGLSDAAGEQAAAPDRWAWTAGTVFDQPEPEELIELTVIVPARNEEDCLGACRNNDRQLDQFFRFRLN